MTQNLGPHIFAPNMEMRPTTRSITFDPEQGEHGECTRTRAQNQPTNQNRVHTKPTTVLSAVWWPLSQVATFVYTSVTAMSTVTAITKTVAHED